MSIERNEGAERETRVERMMTEFREARTRRLEKRNEENVGVSKPAANPKAPLAGSATSH